MTQIASHILTLKIWQTTLLALVILLNLQSIISQFNRYYDDSKYYTTYIVIFF